MTPDPEVVSFVSNLKVRKKTDATYRVSTVFTQVPNTGSLVGAGKQGWSLTHMGLYVVVTGAVLASASARNLGGFADFLGSIRMDDLLHLSLSE